MAQPLRGLDDLIVRLGRYMDDAVVPPSVPRKYVIEVDPAGVARHSPRAVAPEIRQDPGVIYVDPQGVASGPGPGELRWFNPQPQRWHDLLR